MSSAQLQYNIVYSESAIVYVGLSIHINSDTVEEKKISKKKKEKIYIVI